jgi:ribosomal protein S18 acetylase RimI-like enzyme
MVHVRRARPEDAAAIAAVRAESWRTAYAGIIPDRILAEATGARSVARHRDLIRSERWPRILVAEAVAEVAAGPGPDAGADDEARVVGFAHFGAERDEGTAPGQAPSGAGSGPGHGSPGAASGTGQTPGGADGGPARAARAGAAEQATAELYAIYVAPQWWSAGAGRALMTAVLESARRARYGAINLWVLADNARARRFYERAGFAPTGESQLLPGLGGVTEVRYQRSLS